VDLQFRRAGPADTALAQALYRRVLEHLGATGDLPRWHSEGRPSPEQVARWVDAGDLYLAVGHGEDGGPGAARVAGAVMLDHQAPETYRSAPWEVEAGPREVLLLHALAVAPDLLRRGVARFLVDSSLDLARSRGCRAVRLDAYVENVPARELYTRHGFVDLGVHTLRYEGTDLSQFRLFEKVL
jgi:ribosomal protein S18 acetylase RimI-like enzyme